MVDGSIRCAVVRYREGDLMPPYVLALDQGTTSSRAIAFDRDGRALASAQQEFPQRYPQPGWVEHDPADIWDSQISVAREVLDRLAPNLPAAIGISNQRETAIVWERSTGAAVCHERVWKEQRPAGVVYGCGQ